VPFFAATDASKPFEQQPTLRRRKVTNNVDPAESANANERARCKLTAITVLAFGTSVLEGAFGLTAARAGNGNGRDVPEAEPRA
jgi:hypothetical protein